MNSDPLGVIIAGGQSRRFQPPPSLSEGQESGDPIDKFLMPFGQTTLLDHIIHRARQQISNLILNVNGDVARVMSCGLDVIGDDRPDEGPLGGILAAMKAAKARDHRHIITFAGDSPFFPDDYVARLVGVKGRRIVIAESGGQCHPVMGIFEVSLYDDLKSYIDSGERRVMAWVKRHPHSKVVWDKKTPDPFFNINRQEDLENARKYLSTGIFEQ
ncbi:MAG: molybdenum cofactor guanylyltransferase [Emcibacter sp.]|nr:molybdenum cofactor guanylyltransferase [Emcibacter sp.]